MEVDEGLEPPCVLELGLERTQLNPHIDMPWAISGWYGVYGVYHAGLSRILGYIYIYIYSVSDIRGTDIKRDVHFAV